jgi:hypothetical protein
METGKMCVLVDMYIITGENIFFNYKNNKLFNY